MAPGLLLMLWTVPRLGPQLSPLWFAALIVNLIASAAAIMGFQFLWGSMAFWAPRAAEEINSSTSRLLHELRPYPLDGLSGTLTACLLGFLPVGFLGWVPSRALLALDSRPLSLWVTPIAAAGFVLLGFSMFQKGMKRYGRTGSQRYVGHGHRG